MGIQNLLRYILVRKQIHSTCSETIIPQSRRPSGALAEPFFLKNLQLCSFSLHVSPAQFYQKLKLYAIKLSNDDNFEGFILNNLSHCKHKSFFITNPVWNWISICFLFSGVIDFIILLSRIFGNVSLVKSLLLKVFTMLALVCNSITEEICISAVRRELKMLRRML